MPDAASHRRRLLGTRDFERPAQPVVGVAKVTACRRPQRRVGEEVRGIRYRDVAEIGDARKPGPGRLDHVVRSGEGDGTALITVDRHCVPVGGALGEPAQEGGSGANNGQPKVGSPRPHGASLDQRVARRERASPRAEELIPPACRQGSKPTEVHQRLDRVLQPSRIGGDAERRGDIVGRHHIASKDLEVGDSARHPSRNMSAGKFGSWVLLHTGDTIRSCAVRNGSQSHWRTRGDQLRDVVEAEDRDGLIGHLRGLHPWPSGSAR